MSWKIVFASVPFCLSPLELWKDVEACTMLQELQKKIGRCKLRLPIHTAPEHYYEQLTKPFNIDPDPKMGGGPFVSVCLTFSLSAFARARFSAL